MSALFEKVENGEVLSQSNPHDVAGPGPPNPYGPMTLFKWP